VPARREDRRAAGTGSLRKDTSWLSRSRKFLSSDTALLQILIGVGVLAAIVAAAAILYGPVNPITVRIR
jgi:hypothetical protein